MYYRRKIILSLLQLFEGELEKIRLQKLLFLFSSRQIKPDYDFVPYKFGCYSYSANADMTTMVTKGYLSESKESFRKLDSINYLTQLKPLDRKSLSEIKKGFGNMPVKTLIKYTYLTYPFYATKSEILEKILSKEEVEKVKKENPKNTGTVLFTIGYEGISLEEYLTRLLKDDVRVLIDVRNNPLSMKYGFSKNQLKKYCESLGLQYLHFPEVGIQSQQRQELNNQTDYDKLFADYRKKSLPKTKQTQTNIFDLLIQHKRIALTCFEANVCQCHRKHLAEAIIRLPNWKYELKHI